MGKDTGTRTSDLRGKTEMELGVMIRERCQELMNLRFQRATARLEKPAHFRALKRERARILTVLREKKK